MTPLLAYKVRRDLDGSFEAVYRNYVRDVYGFSLSLLGNADDAEDVTQTTFLNAYRALQRGEDVRNLRAWLLAIAHNVCRQRFRTAARRPQTVELDPDAAEAYVDEDAPTADEIRRAMGQLNFNQRTVLVLREIEGLAYEEIAQAMELSLSAVETLLFRARQGLREQLEAAENDLGCDAVQRLISLQLDAKLSRQDRGLLRAHLRTCSECAKMARSQRARKRVMPSLIAVPLPAGLTGAFGGGAGVVTSKLAVLAVGAALVGAGALVETDVIHVPGINDRKTPAVAAAVQDIEASGSPGAQAGLSFQRTKRASQKAVAAKDKRAGKGKKQGNGSKAGPAGGAQVVAAGQAGQGTQGSGSGGTAGSSGSGGSGGSAQAGSGSSGVVGNIVGGVTGGPPPQVAVPTVPDVIGTVGGIVGGAQGNLPPLPVSPPIEPPSLPPVLPPVQLPPVPGVLP